MALIKCPDCGRDVSDAAPACPNCGRPTSIPRPIPSPPPLPPLGKVKETNPLAGAKYMKAFGIVVLWVVGVFFLLAIIGSVMPVVPHHVTYQLTGSEGAASITIKNETGGTEQHTVPVPWTREFDAPAGRFLYLSAQNKGDGLLQATIYVDARAIQHAETTQPYGIASVSGTVGSLETAQPPVSPETRTLDRMVAEHNRKEAAAKKTVPASKP